MRAGRNAAAFRVAGRPDGAEGSRCDKQGAASLERAGGVGCSACPSRAGVLCRTVGEAAVLSIAEWFVLERILKGHRICLPSKGQGHLRLHQSAQSPTWLDRARCSLANYRTF